MAISSLLKRYFLFSAVALQAVAVAHGATLLNACPGEDASRGMRIAWHSKSGSCGLLYGLAGEGLVRRAECRRVAAPVKYNGMEDYFLYRAGLSDLKPGAQYTYAVVEDGVTGTAQTFRTAPATDEFSFLWIGDIHSTPTRPDKIKSVERLLAQAEEASRTNGGIAFVLCSGDAVKYGRRYECWREWDGSSVFSRYMVAAVPGNKEYYGDAGKTRWHDGWFTCAKNNPPNGAPGLGATYWFIYGGVLFVGIDTLAEEGVAMDDDVRCTAAARQLRWFEEVAAREKGRHLIVFQHYPYFKKDGPCRYGRYDFWREAFDRHGVDFALSGDSHSYVRSRSGATVYVVCPEIDSHIERPSLSKGDGMVSVYDEKPCSYGACWFSVSREAITMHYICGGVEDCDTVTVSSAAAP